jgi:hypothetical protein
LRYLSLSLLLAAELCFGATRVVQFAGSTGVKTPRADAIRYSQIQNENGIDCRVVISNTGNLPQIIDRVEFVNGNGFTVATLSAKSFGGTGCLSAADRTLNPGQTCTVRYLVPAQIFDGQWGACSGRITVRDVDPTTPGSLVATGAIHTYQVSMVTDGHFSGALYQSGHQWQSSVPDSAPDLTTTLSYGSSRNMNVACQQGCINRRGLANATWCRQHCGDPIGVTVPGAGTDFRPYDDDADPTTVSTLSRPHGAFAGGLVSEMIVGPSTSICNGNSFFADQPFFSYGGTSDFPERLYCAHHNRWDTIISVSGEVTSFPVNGGLPF